MSQFSGDADDAVSLAALAHAVMVGVAIVPFALASFASATQDTATDGMAAEQFEGAMLVRANAVQVAGTMIGFFLGGSGCLVVIGLFGRTTGFLSMSIVVLIGLVLAMLWRELATALAQHRPEKARLGRVIRRPGAPIILAVALLTAMTASASFGLSKLFLVDRGWSLDAIDRIGPAGGAATVFVSCGVAPSVSRVSAFDLVYPPASARVALALRSQPPKQDASLR